MAASKTEFSPERVGIRDLKARLSEHVRRVKDGQVLVITEHGRPVARIIPEGLSEAERFDQLVASGRVAWNGKRFELPGKPAATLDGGSVSDLVSEGRD